MKKMNMSSILAIGSFSFIFLAFQNCSEVNFSTNTSSPSSNTAVGGQDTINNPLGDDKNDLIPDIPDTYLGGLEGGHFDLDTSSEVYEFNEGETDKHVHEYDDKHNVTYADFFNLLDKDLHEIKENVTPNHKFILLIANSQLSTGAILEINGVRQYATEYQKNVESFINGKTNALKTYTIASSAEGAVKLESLKILFEPDAISKGGLIPTETDCVVSNKPGKNGEYRNGALIIQAIDVTKATFNSQTGTAINGLLWEATLFWHKDKSCN